MNSESDNVPSVWMWVGRLTPPITHQREVPRQALLARLQAQPQPVLTLIISPPGFGKTTLLTQWRSALLQRGTSVAWLSLEEADADANRFLAYVLLALEGAGVALGALSQRAHSQSMDPNAELTVAALLQALQRRGERITLILDDYQHVASPAVDAVCLRLLEQGARWLNLVIASRVRPQWPLATLKVRGLLQELDGSDLILSLPEATRILEDADLGPEVLHEIHTRTEGWAVAVQLARLWFSRHGQGNHDRGQDLLPRLSGRVADIAHYMAEQIFENMPEDCREFLLETSLLDRFNGELADEVRGRRDSAALLERLQPFEALLVPLDAGRRWFRYHGMLADFLRTRLDPVRAREIHRAAARWLAQQHDWVLAVTHALQAHDVALAIRVVQQAGGWKMVLHNGIRYTQSVLQPFDALSKRTKPELLLIQAYLHAKLGEQALSLELLRIAAATVENAPELKADFVVIHALVHVYFDQFGNDPDWPMDADTASQRLPDDLLGQAVLLCVGTVAALAHGRMQQAVAAAADARIRMRLVGSQLGENYCLMHASHALSIQGDIPQGRRMMEEALVLAETNFGTDSSLQALVGCLKAQHLYWCGQWNEAEPWLHAAQETLLHVDGWLDLFAATTEVAWRMGLRRKGLHEALSVLDAAAQQARARGLERLSHLVLAWRIDLLAQCGYVAQAQQEADHAALSQHLETQWHAQTDNSLSWRFLEAGALAQARLHLAHGADAAAHAGLQAAMHWFERHDLHLPVWRLRLLSLLAPRRERSSGDTGQIIEQALVPVLRHGLAGLLLETGPGILSVLQPREGALPPAIIATMTRLRGWRAHPLRPTASFSPKETAVLQRLMAGHSNKAIARALGISENTVKYHLKHIFQRLDVDNRAAAIAAALQQGLATAPVTPIDTAADFSAD